MHYINMPIVSKVVVNESMSRLIPDRLILWFFLIQESLLAAVYIIYIVC